MTTEPRSKDSLHFQELWSGFCETPNSVPTLPVDKLTTFEHLTPWIMLSALDFEARTSTVQYAGSKICDLIGTDLTGVNMASSQFMSDPLQSWEQRRQYYDEPCGFHEVIEAQAQSGQLHLLKITNLPYYDEHRAPCLIVLVEAGDLLVTKGTSSVMVKDIRESTRIDLSQTPA